MFKGYATLLVAVMVMASCSVQQEAIEITPDLSSLEGSKWIMKDCPHDPFLIINGFGDCDYLHQLEFTDGMVIITNNGFEKEIPHHICQSDGNVLNVSVQECTSSSWRPMFVWHLIAMDENTLTMMMEVPNIMSDYQVEFNFSRTQ